MAKTEEYLSQSKYAEHRNVTKGYIGRMVKEGRLHLIKGKLNVEMSDEALDIFVYNFVALKILNPNFEVLEKNMNEPETPTLKKVNKPYKIRREGSFVNGFR